jgi:8-oxo-dGTP pyrophosphatase MutT (NUDIX family)
MRDRELADLSEEEITGRLAEASSRQKDRLFPYTFDEPPRPAAVLIPLLREADHWRVLFTRRTGLLVEHSGQVAFPGGRADPQDASPEQTALREADEEIGLKPSDVRVLGCLRRLHTITNYLVTPVVGAIPWPYSFRLAFEEVSRVFTIPLAWLVDPGNHEVRERVTYLPLPPVPVIYFKEYEGELLWGVSAQIMIDLLAALRLH